MDQIAYNISKYMFVLKNHMSKTLWPQRIQKIGYLDDRKQLQLGTRHPRGLDSDPSRDRKTEELIFPSDYKSKGCLPGFEKDVPGL